MPAGLELDQKALRQQRQRGEANVQHRQRSDVGTQPHSRQSLRGASPERYLARFCCMHIGVHRRLETAGKLAAKLQIAQHFLPTPNFNVDYSGCGDRTCQGLHGSFADDPLLHFGAQACKDCKDCKAHGKEKKAEAERGLRLRAALTPRHRAGLRWPRRARRRSSRPRR